MPDFFERTYDKVWDFGERLGNPVRTKKKERKK